MGVNRHLTNPLHVAAVTATTSPTGRLCFQIASPADFRFYRYEVLFT